MRHLRSLSYAVVLAPTTWTLSAVAFTQELTGRARTEGSIEVLTGFLLLLLAGSAYAILLLPRFSPVGPIATGVLFLAVCVWVIIDAASFEGLFPAGVRKPGFDLTLPAHGLAALLAVPLLCTALSRRRWRESRFDPVDANTSTIIWPFARPARPGTLIVPGVTGVPTSDATQVLHLGEPADATQTLPGSADRTQVVGELSPDATTRPVPPPGDATQVIPPPAEATQALPPTPTASQAPAADATQALPPAAIAAQTANADATQALPSGGAQIPAADGTQALPPGATATQTPAADATQVLPPAGGADEPAPSAAGATASGTASGTGTETGTAAEAGPGGPLPDDGAADPQLVAPSDATGPTGPSTDTDTTTVAGAERPADDTTEQSPAAPAPRRQTAHDTDATHQL